MASDRGTAEDTNIISRRELYVRKKRTRPKFMRVTYHVSSAAHVVIGADVAFFLPSALTSRKLSPRLQLSLTQVIFSTNRELRLYMNDRLSNKNGNMIHNHDLHFLFVSFTCEYSQFFIIKIAYFFSSSGFLCITKLCIE